jgi:hypothetical protein
VSPDAGGVGEARGGRVRKWPPSGTVAGGIGRKCVFYNGFVGSVPKGVVVNPKFKVVESDHVLISDVRDVHPLGTLADTPYNSYLITTQPQPNKLMGGDP